MLKNVFKRSYFSNAYISITFLKSSTITVFIDKIKVKLKVLLRIKSSLLDFNKKRLLVTNLLRDRHI